MHFLLAFPASILSSCSHKCLFFPASMLLKLLLLSSIFPSSNVMLNILYHLVNKRKLNIKVSCVVFSKRHLNIARLIRNTEEHRAWRCIQRTDLDSRYERNSSSVLSENHLQYYHEYTAHWVLNLMLFFLRDSIKYFLYSPYSFSPSSLSNIYSSLF